MQLHYVLIFGDYPVLYLEVVRTRKAAKYYSGLAAAAAVAVSAAVAASERARVSECLEGGV